MPCNQLHSYMISVSGNLVIAEVMITGQLCDSSNTVVSWV